MLAWIAGDGWGQFWERKGEPWSNYENAEAFRNRHLLGSMKHLAGSMKALFDILSRR